MEAGSSRSQVLRPERELTDPAKPLYTALRQKMKEKMIAGNLPVSRMDLSTDIVPPRLP